MTTRERLQAALQQLIDIDQETLSVSVADNDHTEDECYNNARVWLERALACRASSSCERCGDTGIDPGEMSFDAGDGEGEDRPCSACS